MLSRLYGWLAAAAMAVLAVVGALMYRRGRVTERQAAVVDQAKQRANTADAILKRNEVRRDVDAQVAKLPANPVGQVTVPASLPVPGSAADELQRNWSRD